MFQAARHFQHFTLGYDRHAYVTAGPEFRRQGMVGVEAHGGRHRRRAPALQHADVPLDHAGRGAPSRAFAELWFRRATGLRRDRVRGPRSKLPRRIASNASCAAPSRSAPAAALGRCSSSSMTRVSTPTSGRAALCADASAVNSEKCMHRGRSQARIGARPHGHRGWSVRTIRESLSEREEPRCQTVSIQARGSVRRPSPPSFARPARSACGGIASSSRAARRGRPAVRRHAAARPRAAARLAPRAHAARGLARGDAERGAQAEPVHGARLPLRRREICNCDEDLSR